MQKIFLLATMALSLSAFANDAFWPPDLVPHPMPPTEDQKEREMS